VSQRNRTGGIRPTPPGDRLFISIFSIDIAPVPDLEDEHDEPVVLDAHDRPVFTDPEGLERGFL
jgi:hypothetical protein